MLVSLPLQLPAGVALPLVTGVCVCAAFFGGERTFILPGHNARRRVFPMNTSAAVGRSTPATLIHSYER